MTAYLSPFLWRERYESSRLADAIKPSPVVRTGKRGAKRPVYQLTRDGEVIRQFPSLSEAAMATGAAIDNIMRAATGLRKSAGGFGWRYANPAGEILRDRHGGAYSKASQA
jgi:hypothetical protein